MSKTTARKLKPIPRFRTEAEERRFWETHDSTDYLDWAKAYIVKGLKDIETGRTVEAKSVFSALRAKIAAPRRRAAKKAKSQEK